MMSRSQEDMKRRSYTEVFYTSTKPWLSRHDDVLSGDVRQEILRHQNEYPSTKNVLYLHFPFCAKRCDYCIYYSTSYKKNIVARYLRALEKEIDLVKETPYIQSTNFRCVYFGGGTPSLMNHNEIRRIFRVLSDSFLFTNDVEITFEANPSTLTDEKLHVLKESGCNRISLGIQSFRDEILRKNNCNHTVQRALYVIDLILREGFVLNVDMLFGLENQTEKDLLLELNSLCSISKPLQLSLFPVRILPNTPLYEKTASTFEPEAHTENMITLDKTAENYLLKHSFIREEIPIFYYEKGSRAHVYNSAEARIIGLGPSAGTVLDRGFGVNISDVNEFCELLDQNESPNKSGTYLTEQQNYEKFVFNRILFMNRSLPDFRDIVAKRFNEYYGCELNGIYEKVVNDMLNKNYIFIKEGIIHFTKRFNKILDHFRLGAPSII